jgi:hypothetical protein
VEKEKHILIANGMFKKKMDIERHGFRPLPITAVSILTHLFLITNYLYEELKNVTKNQLLL